MKAKLLEDLILGATAIAIPALVWLGVEGYLGKAEWPGVKSPVKAKAEPALEYPPAKKEPELLPDINFKNIYPSQFISNGMFNGYFIAEGKSDNPSIK